MRILDRLFGSTTATKRTTTAVLDLSHPTRDWRSAHHCLWMLYRGSGAGPIDDMLDESVHLLMATGTSFDFRPAEFDTDYDPTGNWHYLGRKDQRTVAEYVANRQSDDDPWELWRWHCLHATASFYEYAATRIGRPGYREWLDNFVDIHEPIIRAFYYIEQSRRWSRTRDAEKLLDYWRMRDWLRKRDGLCEDCGATNVRLYHQAGRFDAYDAETSEFVPLCFDCSMKHFPDGYTWVRHP